MLQNKGLDINMTDNYGINAFWIAAFSGNVEVMKELAE